MRILVYDVAAENGGAVTVLNWFYGIHKEDKENQYVYLLGKHTLENTDNITVINVPEVKKTWTIRLSRFYPYRIRIFHFVNCHRLFISITLCRFLNIDLALMRIKNCGFIKI